MKWFTSLFLIGLLMIFSSPAFAGQGGSGREGSGGGQPPADLEGPLNDKMSNQGKLFGDLLVILRYQGGEEKNIPVYDTGGNFIGWETGIAIGGEPILTEDYAQYAEVDENTGDILGIFTAPSPSLCVQPVASYLRWGNIHDATGDYNNNQIPLIKSYDTTWGRTECDVGLPLYDANGTQLFDEHGEPLYEEWFINPGAIWTDPSNGEVTYQLGVLWEELIQEVHFGRLNLSRAPEAVLQSSFDEAISTINQAVKIELDPSGRLLLTRRIDSELYVAPETGLPLPEDPEYFVKAIDSPLENLSLYVKLLKDGHLVTPADERQPIDRSLNGGIPLTQLVELTDGPSQDPRPTINIELMRKWGLYELVDVNEVEYYTQYEITYTGDCTPTNHVLVTSPFNCSDQGIGELDSCGNATLCNGPYIGIVTDTGSKPSGDDYLAAASFFAAAADKTGYLTEDMIVYLNSILGINLVVGYSETDEDGLPTADAVNYSTNPVYFDFSAVTDYNRIEAYRNRGEVLTTGGTYTASTYTGAASVLWEDESTPNVWLETDLSLLKNVDFGPVAIGWGENPDTVYSGPEPTNIFGSDDILGFTQMAEDNLRVIDFIHTFQIPDRR